MDKWEGAQLNRAKEILAYELTKLVHGEDEAKKAEASAKALFGAGAAAEIPMTELTDADFTDGIIDIGAILVKSGLVPSKSEARRAIEQGGVAANDEKVTDFKKTYTANDLKDGIVFRRGKKNFRKVIAK